MNDSLKLVRSELLEIKPFDPSRPDLENCTLLDANELAWNNYQFHNIAFNRYIDGMFDPELLKALSDYYQIEAHQLLLTRGSCEGIDLLVRVFCRAYQDSILVCPPTFSIFAQCAAFQGANVISVPLIREQDFALDVKGVLNALTPNTKLVFICSPNNPTGNLIAKNDILTLVKALAGKAMVVVDEAYIDFAQDESVTPWVKEFGNLIVLRTLSKAFGLAALRAGVIITQQPLIPILAGMMMPFALSVLTTEALKKAFSPRFFENVRETIKLIQQERTHFKAALSSCPIVKKVWNSEGNFLFMQLHQIKDVLRVCHEQKILVRHFMGVKGYEDCLRVTVGLREQNQSFVEILQSLSLVTEVI